MFPELQPSNVLRAAERLEGIANRTPVITSRTLDERCDCTVFLKGENFQRVGAFKFRGAYHALSRLSPEEKAAGVITHSSGNHAQGVALAARLLEIPAIIVMPEDAPAVKREATAGYGATIIPCKAIEREQVTADLIAEHGYTLIHPYDNSDIILGQGTAAAELFTEVGQLDYLFVPVGGGGLISGSALAAAALSPQCRVIGVEPELAADANQSWRDERILQLDHVPPTIADGLRTRAIGRRNLEVMTRYVDDMLTVSEKEIVDTLQFIWNYLKIIVEPSSAVALAPLFSGKYDAAGARVGVILSGGNVALSAADLYAPGNQESEPAVADEDKVETAGERPPVLVTDREFPHEALHILRDVAVVHFGEEANLQAPDYEDDLYRAIIVDPQQRIGANVIENSYNLLAIGCAATSLDNIDVSAARNFGLELCYVPDGNAVAIAEHTIGRLLQLEDEFDTGGLAGKTLGLIGFGRIGQQVAQRAAAFNMQVLVNQPRLTPELAVATGVEAADLVDLLQRADFISLHIPYNQETTTLIGPDALAYMKETAFLINSGHTDLIDEKALLVALQAGRLAGAALSTVPEELRRAPTASDELRDHPLVLVSPHVSTIIDQQRPSLSMAVARQIVDILEREEARKLLPLELVPVNQVTPHEEVDEKRVERLMQRLEKEQRLMNPPITARWKGRYVVLDGATRFTALERLGFEHIVVQAIDPGQPGLQLHTWYHAISNPDTPFQALFDRLTSIPNLRLQALGKQEIRAVLSDKDTLCYFLDQQGDILLARAANGANRLDVMKQLVQVYTTWGDVERTLLTDLPRLTAQFPDLQAVAVFPQFAADDVFDAARAGRYLPAGLTRFIIPGRILRLNADLERLKREEPVSEKQAWFDAFIAEKLRRSRFRLYQEPVVLLDE